MFFVRGAAYGSPMTIPKWATGALAAAALVTSTGCGTSLSYDEFQDCMDAGMPVARQDVADGADQKATVRDLMDVCGYEDLSESERDKIPDPS